MKLTVAGGVRRVSPSRSADRRREPDEDPHYQRRFSNNLHMWLTAEARGKLQQSLFPHGLLHRRYFPEDPR
jgi:hypothetical protein